MLKKVQEFYKRNERYKPFMFVGMLCLVTVIGITIAYYTQEMNITNTFKTMTYDVSMEEEFYNTWGTKRITINNNEESNTPVLLRVSYSEMWTKGDKTLNNLVNGTNVVNKTWSQTFLDDFTLDSDGWYYYDKLLLGDDSIELLESISLDSTIASTHPEYTKYNYDLNFNYETIGASVNAAKEIWDKDIVINGSNVIWE